MGTRFALRLAGCLAVTLVAAPAARAQAITVQQPVVDLFTIGTTVTVPDRGSTALGGISSARDIRTRVGFSPFGSSLGMERSYTAASATVYIHDFEALDAALLREAESRRSPPAVPQNPLAARAYQSLLRENEAEQRRAMTTSGATRLPTLPPPAAAWSRPPHVQRATPDATLESGIAGERTGSAPPTAPASPSLSETPSPLRRWSARSGSASHAPSTLVRERFGRRPQDSAESPPSSGSAAASSLSTNSGESPAASLAPR